MMTTSFKALGITQKKGSMGNYKPEYDLFNFPRKECKDFLRY